MYSTCAVWEHSKYSSSRKSSREVGDERREMSIPHDVLPLKRERNRAKCIVTFSWPERHGFGAPCDKPSRTSIAQSAPMLFTSTTPGGFYDEY
ncbi:hypothetical protein TNCV_3251181 [Trichonephila clavipes]|nr:hypothetical protein TNCV_3251181 [Trichonephila clavipes]